MLEILKNYMLLPEDGLDGERWLDIFPSDQLERKTLVNTAT